MKLGVNIDHVATLRQARLPAGRQAGGGVYPDPVTAARICQKAGAHSIVMHLREDRRHIQPADLFKVQKAVSIKLNLEMSMAPSVVEVARRLAPSQITLVPEKREERTTESGLDLFKAERPLGKITDLFRKKGIVVSFFIDPDPRQIKQARRLGAAAVEFHTGCYANARDSREVHREWLRLKEAVGLANALKIIAHAGHGLDYQNVSAIKKIKGIEELNIGYSIISEALWIGLRAAVKKMRALIS